MPYLAGDQFDISWGESHCCISHDLCFDGAKSSCSTGLYKAVQYHIQQVCYLQTVIQAFDFMQKNVDLLSLLFFLFVLVIYV